MMKLFSFDHYLTNLSNKYRLWKQRFDKNEFKVLESDYTKMKIRSYLRNYTPNQPQIFRQYAQIYISMYIRYTCKNKISFFIEIQMWI